MAFKHPHKLVLRKRKVESTEEDTGPMYRDRRGRRRYNWDGWYANISTDPIESRKRDPWSLAEYLDEERQARQIAQEQNKVIRDDRLERMEIDPEARKDTRNRSGKWRRQRTDFN